MRKKINSTINDLILKSKIAEVRSEHKVVWTRKRTGLKLEEKQAGPQANVRNQST